MRNVKKEKRVTKLKTSYVRLIATGFLLMILVGTCLLMLPCATRSGESTSFLDALFTATSAGCVTGLIVVDTYTHWSLFGQLVILGLIQIGGLGFITIGVYVAVLLKKRIGLWEREALNESV
ncbi:MAG: Trk family potassium uptake protein, partial [Lachnospiraceae bacterium]|nr:Trk family potassium uptake protein [Lachnospiraceae bacterium]